MSGSAAGPLSPAAYSPSNTAAKGAASRATGEVGGLPPAADSQASACLPQRPMGRGQVRDGGDRGSTGSDPRWCRACWTPKSWGTALGAVASGQTGGSSFSRNSFTAAISWG